MPKVNRVTKEEIIQFHKIYRTCGNYAEVARQTGRSAATVAKYIKNSIIVDKLTETAEGEQVRLKDSLLTKKEFYDYMNKYGMDEHCKQVIILD